jgi:hypothetical protein
MHPTLLRSASSFAAFAAAMGLLIFGGLACDETAPNQLLTNHRVGTFELTSAIPNGGVTLEGSLDQISVTIGELPVLSSDFAYEGWISYGDTSATFNISTGRFRIFDTGGIDPIHRTGEVTFTYDRGGGFAVNPSDGDELAQGEALPDSVELTEGVTFFLAIETDPDNSPNPGVIHILMTEDVLPDDAGDVDLILPVSLGEPSQGDFSQLDGTVLLNAATGEIQLTFHRMPFLDRSSPPDDPGLIYQIWFVDDDQSPPRYRSVAGRGGPNSVGDFFIEGPPIEPGDADSDGVPEPMDFERVLVSIEPDGLTAQQPVGQGLDTSGEIFPVVPYRVRLPLPVR